MAVEYLDRDEWRERTEGQEVILIGAFVPSLNEITMEIGCRDCGRPVYVSPYEKGATRVLCILCGLKHFDESDRETIGKALLSGRRGAGA